MKDITWDSLYEVLDYNPDSGIFTWKRNTGLAKTVGKTAGSKNSNGYINMSVLGRKYSAHRLAWFYCFKEWPSGNIDHIDRDRSNNKLDNLRDVSQSINVRNSVYGTGISGVRNVYKSGSKWKAASELHGKYVYLGTYNTLEEAKVVSEAYTAKQYENTSIS